MRDQTDVFPRIRTKQHGILLRPPRHMRRNACLQPISLVIIYRRKRTKIVRAQSIQPPHVCVAGAVDHAIRLSFVQMHRNDPFAQSIPVTAFPRCAAVRIQPVKEKHEYVAAPDRGGIVPERRFRPCFPRNTFPAALMQQRGVDLQPLFPQDRKGGVMVFPLRFIKKGTCQINVHTRHPVTDFSVKSNRRAYSGGGFAVALRAGSADAAAHRAERRAAIFCAAVRTPRAGGADAAAYRAERRAAIFCAAVRTPQTGDVICLRADEPAARFRKCSALTTKKRDIPSRFLIVLNRCGNYTNSMIAVSEASPRRSPRGMMRV